MKKLKLRAIELGATEILTREQLKKVLGGDFGSGNGSGGSGSGSSWPGCRPAGYPCHTGDIQRCCSGLACRPDPYDQVNLLSYTCQYSL